MPGKHASKRSTVAKGLAFTPHKMRARHEISHADHGTYTLSPKHGVVYTPHNGDPKKLGTFGSRTEAIAGANTHHESIGKGLGLMSIDDCYDLAVKAGDAAGRAAYMADAARRTAPDPKRTASVDRPAPSVPDVATRPKKFPRKLKPTVQMKPISDAEAMSHIAARATTSQKAMRWLAAIKALATGYGKTSGGGALKAANRGAAAMPLLGPNGRPGRGSRSRKKIRQGRPNFGTDGRHGPRGDKASFGLKRVRAKREARMSARKGDRDLFVEHQSGVVIKSEGAEMPSQRDNVNFNDLFKSELAGDHLVDCPHCDAPITKSDLAKGKGAKRGKSGASVRAQNPEGGTMRGGDGRGVLTPSRGVPGAQKTDPPVGVQNGKGSSARKGGADSSIEEGEDDVGKSDGAPEAPAQQPAAPAAVKKSISIRGTEFVQYVDDGSDAEIAKSIAEGRLGGTQPTQPLDLNNDLARLLY